MLYFMVSQVSQGVYLQSISEVISKSVTTHRPLGSLVTMIKSDLKFAYPQATALVYIPACLKKLISV